MEPINLFLMDMSHAGNTSGVDRYMGTLLKGLRDFPFIRVYWIHLRHDPFILFHSKEQTPSYTKITIPLPQQFNEIIGQKFWINKYNEQVYRIIGYLFENKKDIIIHIHTLNLIDLAIFIRTITGCKIITHLHCIPWKGLYNNNIRKFNELFNLIYIKKEQVADKDKFVTNHSEIQSYTDADRIICVTHCAKDFLKNSMAIPSDKISVIPNGMGDFRERSERRENRDCRIFQLFYVGVLSPGKGLKYILDAMRKVQQRGYQVSLTIAGKVSPLQAENIKVVNKDLSLNILGRIPFNKLKEYYARSDAGIIASLQEQSSYVAIEMAMFGLPVITTAVDGLDEMFTDNLNALKVDTCFSTVRGLSVNTGQMSDEIIELIEDKSLRTRLSRNVRQLYENRFTLERMMKQTLEVYQQMIGGIEYA
ncbi:glycosyltransferase family 4 protein [Proteiniphilum acetatigenes]|uniref:glycosyltransferase family 4 protein n=1 Tax=Proteiniphilum acetatigenes TaxID=294710 RepID=UPI00037E8405|nr:glycosyltransferase family 4 protein [Proteiniphilum acetatigenes]SFL33252.1 Glycosyltransferase involved in cell wall bisynthesis [Porphyromonadaceae bacterium KH3CP3RA]